MVIPIGMQTKILLYALGDAPEQCEFTIYYPNSTILYHKPPGALNPDDVFYIFCVGPCEVVSEFFIVLRDSWCDGWNGNTIVIQQGSNTF